MEGDEELKDLYREILLDYFHSGTHKGRLDPADFITAGINPVCGDHLTLTAKVADGKIKALRFDGHGCVISQSSAAMMAEALEGKTPAEAIALAREFKDGMLGHKTFAEFSQPLEELKALEGVARFPIRVKCATLAWNTVLAGLKSLEEGKSEPAQFQEN